MPNLARTNRTLKHGARIAVAVCVVAVGLAGAAVPASAAPAAVTIGLSLDTGAIRADGRDAAALQVTVTNTGTGLPVPNATFAVKATWAMPGTGAVKFTTKPFVTDGNGQRTVTVTSKRSGAMTITASIGSYTYKGTASIGLTAKRRSVVVFANGANTFTTCPTPSTCGDPTGFLDPVRTALAAQGFTAADMPWFSYKGGAIDPSTHAWVPAASTCFDSALQYKTTISRMKTMLTKIASANPNSDISVVGLSQGGLLAFQMIDVIAKLPAGSRLASVVTLDSPLGGGAPSLLPVLESLGATCWTQGGNSKAALELGQLWDSTAPNQGPAQGDNARILCSLVAVPGCLPQTNQQAVAASTAAVYTWGSSQDGLFNPAACGLTGYPDASQTQTVTGAGGGLHAEGGTGGSVCPLTSHTAVVANRAGAITAAIGPQQ